MTELLTVDRRTRISRDLRDVLDLLSDLYSPREAELWMIIRQPLLGNQRPAMLIAQDRTAEVIAVVNDLREGVFA